MNVWSSLASIRKFLYATLLALASLNVAPSLASAQEMDYGNFTLKHDVLPELPVRLRTSNKSRLASCNKPPVALP